MRSEDGLWEWDGRAWRPATRYYSLPRPDLTPKALYAPLERPYPIARPGEGRAIASFALGIGSLLAWLLPIAGIPAAVVGLVLGAGARDGVRPRLATAGVCLSAIGLALGLVSAAVDAYLGAFGHIP